MTQQLLAQCGHVASGFVAMLLMVAGLLKHRARQFESIVSEYRLLPSWGVPVTARVIPLMEVSFGLALFALPRSWPVRVACAGLFLVFAVAVAINLYRGRAAIDCGCSFGLARQTLHPGLVIRNAGLAVLLMAPWPPAAQLDWLVHLQGVLGGATLYCFNVIFETLSAVRSQAYGGDAQHG